MKLNKQWVDRIGQERVSEAGRERTKCTIAVYHVTMHKFSLALNEQSLGGFYKGDKAI